MGDISKNCAVNIQPPRIDTLLNGLMANFRQVDTTKNVEIKRYWDEMKPLYEGLVQCWNPKACNDKYIKEVAEADSEQAQDEIIDKMRHMISDLIVDAAKYRIPKLVTDMERSRVYESACSQMLMCDVFDNLSKLDLDNYIKAAGDARLNNVKAYAAIEQGNIREASNQFEVLSRLYQKEDGKVEEKNHINSDIVEEILLMTAFYAITAWILENIYDRMWDKQREIGESIMAKCAG